MIVTGPDIARVLVTLAADLIAKPELRHEAWELLGDLADAVRAHRAAHPGELPPGWMEVGGETYPDLPSNLVAGDTPGGDGHPG